MPDITAQHLAEILMGVARAQAAIVNGIENGHPGTRMNHVMPALQNAAHLRDHPDPTLVDLPVRVLLATFGRAGPDAAAIARDLERLFSGPATAPAAAQAPAAEPAAGEMPDFSAPGG
jgi:hypothetical protein